MVLFELDDESEIMGRRLVGQGYYKSILQAGGFLLPKQSEER